MTNYEIMFILSTQLTDEEKKANVTLVEETLAKSGAESVSTEIWGDRKLAYPIEPRSLNRRSMICSLRIPWLKAKFTIL